MPTETTQYYRFDTESLIALHILRGGSQENWLGAAIGEWNERASGGLEARERTAFRACVHLLICGRK